MAIITLDADTQETAEIVSTMTGKPIDQIIEEALNQQLRHLNRQKIDAETSSFLRLHEELKKQYFGQYVAIHNGNVVATGENFESIVLKVRQEFGRVAVLIRQVEESPIRTIQFRSTRGQPNQ
jgi:hypothetical protein